MIAAIKQKLNILKQKPMLLSGIGSLLLFCFAGFVVYFARVVYSPEWLGQVKGTLTLFLILFTICIFVFSAKKISKQNTAMFMTALIFIGGVCFVFLNPPNQAPDEQSHFLRSYAMAMGDFQFDQKQKFPNDVNLLIEHFPVAYNNGYPAKQSSTVADRFADYNNAVKNGEIAQNSGIIIFQTIPYLPQAIGIFIARLAGIGALGAYYFARLGNLLFYSICCYFALKSAKRFNIILFSVMIMPLTMFMAASCSVDAMLFGLMFLLFGSVLAEKFDNKTAIVFAISLAVLCTSKISYIVFAHLIFAVNKEKWQVKLKLSHYIFITAAVFLALYKGMELYVVLASNYSEIPRTMQGSNPTEQLAFILQNPFRYIVVFLDTIKNNAAYLFSGGLFGWIDVDIKIISYFTPIILMINTIKNAPKFNKSDFSRTAIFFATSILTYAVVLTGMYLSWTPVTLGQVIGVQMRYILPAFVGILMLLAYWINGYMAPCKNTQSQENTAIYTSFVFCLLSSGLLFVAYYLPIKVIVYVS